MTLSIQHRSSRISCAHPTSPVPNHNFPTIINVCYRGDSCSIAVSISPVERREFHYEISDRYEQYLLSILSTISSSLTRFRLNVKVDQEKDGEESSEKNGKVGTELNLKGKGLGGKGLYDGVHGEGGGGDGSDGDGGNGSLLHVEAGFGDALGN